MKLTTSIILGLRMRGGIHPLHVPVLHKAPGKTVITEMKKEFAVVSHESILCVSNRVKSRSPAKTSLFSVISTNRTNRLRSGMHRLGRVFGLIL